MQDCNEKKRVRDDSEESDLNSSEIKRMRDDLLDIPDDSDATIQGLDSVIKSFEEEILLLPPSPVAAPDSSSSDPQSDLGFLLEASDDELGLPPTITSNNENNNGAIDLAGISDDTVRSGEISGYEDEIYSYEPLWAGIGNESGTSNSNINSEFVTVGGLFDYPDEIWEPSDASEVLWRPESLPAA